MHPAEGDHSRRWELERRRTKQAEARLSHGLQDLEEARLFHMNTVIKAQRQVHKELQRLQQGNSQKAAHAMGEGLSQTVGKRPALPMLPPVSGQPHSTSRGERLRAPRSTLPKMEGLTGTAQSPLQQTHARAILDDAGQESSGRPGPTSLRTQAKAASSITDLRHSLARQLNIAAKRAEQEEPNSQGELDRDPTVLSQGQAQASHADGSDTMPQLASCTERRKPPFGPEKLSSAIGACAPHNSQVQPTHSRPAFLELYAEARKARYIRHKGIPASEKELSLQEIFGHENNLTPTSQQQNRSSTILNDGSFPKGGVTHRKR